MQRLSIRKLREADMTNANRTVMSSFNALRRKNGFKPHRVRITRPEPFMVHLMRTDPNGCLGAFIGDQMVGYAQSVVREHQWYLAFLFVKPGKWGRGIGRKLLEKTLKTADPTEVTIYSLCTFSYNPQAIALYSSYGMTPTEPILLFRWARDSKTALNPGKPKHDLRVEVINDYDKLGFINKLDEKNRGLMRPEEHKFAIDSSTTELLLFYDGRKRVGYAATMEIGTIAPISAISPDYLEDMTRICITRVLEADSKMIALHCPGSNARMMQVLLEIGIPIVETNLLLTNKPFGRLDHYIPAHLTVF
jgi:GNAT superfamily N-acetyltransferase